MNQHLPPEIQSLLSREHSVSEPREVLKDKNIKRYKDVSRLSEETDCLKVSSETCLLASTSSSPIGDLDTSVEDLTSSREEDCNNSGHARTTIRGVSAQHSRTNKGVKVMVNIQTDDDAMSGTVVELTAELKRSDRLRELKPYDEDSVEFDKLYCEMLDTLKDMDPAQRREYCVGRLHDRGQRDLWYADMFAIGRLDEHEHLYYLLLNIHGQEFEIHMNESMSARQQDSYHSSGRWGNFVKQRRAPTLASAPRKAWK
jgi:hypothetical protein